MYSAEKVFSVRAEHRELYFFVKTCFGKHMPQVSVIIPTYNRAHLLGLVIWQCPSSNLSGFRNNYRG